MEVPAMSNESLLCPWNEEDVEPVESVVAPLPVIGPSVESDVAPLPVIGSSVVFPVLMNENVYAEKYCPNKFCSVIWNHI